MKQIASGIIRRMDDLGRIVFPRELRRQMGVGEGTPFELGIMEDNGKRFFVAVPYTALGTKLPIPVKDLVSTVANQIEDGCDCIVAIMDKYGTEVSSGAVEKEALLSHYGFDAFQIARESGLPSMVDCGENLMVLAFPLFSEGAVCAALLLCGEVQSVGKTQGMAKTAAAVISAML